MTSNDLLEFQEVMFRAHLRNLMFFVTLPYYLTQQMRCNHVRDADGTGTSDASSLVFLDQYRSDCNGNGA